MKFKNFQKLMITASMSLLGTLHAGNVLANDNANIENMNMDNQTVVTHINQLIKKQYENHVLNHTMSVKVKELKNKYEDEDNSLQIKDGSCELNVAFTKDGKTVKLTQDEDILKLTSPQNDAQKKLTEDFITLHEASHCEFATIQNPIKDFSRDEKFNTELNYSLKNIEQSVGMNAENKTIYYFHYMPMLNETYADVNAFVGLIKSNVNPVNLKDGKLNSDLNYVLNGIITQRENNFITRVAENKISDDHYSSFALKELIKPENLKKINELKNESEIKDFCLNVSNKGVQDAINSNNKLSYHTLNTNRAIEQNLLNNMTNVLVNLKNDQTLTIDAAINKTEENLKGFNFESNTTNVIKSILMKEDLKNIQTLSDEEIYQKAQNIIDSNDYKVEKEIYLTNNKIISQFKEDVLKEGNANFKISEENKSDLIAKSKEEFKEKTLSDNIDYKLDKQSVANKILSLRNNTVVKTLKINKTI